MFKTLILVVSLIIVGTQASAQLRDQSNAGISNRVNQLVNDHIRKLDRRDQRYILNSLRDIEYLFERYGYVASDRWSPNRNIICESQYNRMIDLDNNSKIIYDFNNKPNCDEARLAVLKGWPFCEYQYNRLITTDGQRVVYDFNNGDNCKEAQARVLQGKNFCEYQYNRLISADGRKVIYDFSNSDDCRSAMN